MKKFVVIGIVLLFTMSFLTGCASSRKAELEALQSQVIDLQGQLAQVQTEKSELEGKAATLRDELRGFSEREKIQLEELNQCTILRIPNKLVFASGSATISSQGKNMLDQVAEILEPYPGYEIQVKGHTDNKQIKPEFQDRFADNWELSTARAVNVVRYMLSRHNLDPRKLSAVGHGEFLPLASNETSEGRARNRRVEFYITPGQPIKPLSE